MSRTEVDVIRERIDEIKSMLEATQLAYSHSEIPVFLQQLELSSLEQRLLDLQSKLTRALKAENKEQLSITLYPPNMESGQIPVKTLSLILGGLQDLSDSVANTLYNQPSEHGRIPQEILEHNQLIWRESEAGSFKVLIDVQHSGQAQYDDPMQLQTITELFNLLNNSDVADLLVESLSSLGPRTLRNYRDWTRNLREMQTPVEIEWNSVKGYSRISFDPDKANRIYSVLSNMSDSVEEEVTVLGRLTGANVRTKTFELCTPNGDRISGRIVKDAISSVAAIVLDSKCEAVLTKIITSYSGREKISWSLKSINNSDY